jgi:hypothetical protein
MMILLNRKWILSLAFQARESKGDNNKGDNTALKESTSYVPLW